MIHKEAVRVSVGGKSYTLATDEGHAHVYEAAALVDRMVNEIVSGGLKDEQKATILAALQLASLLIKQQDETLQQQEISTYIMQWVELQNEQLSTFLSV